MKRIFLMLIVFILTLGAQAQSLKGYVLGSNTTAPDKEVTTVGGKKGYLEGRNTDTGILYNISFTTLFDNISEVTEFFKLVRKKYDLKDVKDMHDTKRKGISFVAKKHNSIYVFNIRDSEKGKYFFTFAIAKSEIQKKEYLKAEQNKLNDF